jgi:hypothetical protein
MARSRPCSKIVYATKHSVTETLASIGGLPGAIAVFSRPGLVPHSYADIVRRESLALRAPIAFVGDLDPVGLTTYLSLVSGGFEGKPRPLGAVLYLGIDDAWLELCEDELLESLRLPRLPKSNVPVAICTVMTPFEREHLAVLDAHVDLLDLVGERCLAVLRAGFTVDLAMASDRKRYQSGFAVRLLRHVLGTPQKRGAGEKERT